MSEEQFRDLVEQAKAGALDQLTATAVWHPEPPAFPAWRSGPGDRPSQKIGRRPLSRRGRWLYADGRSRFAPPLRGRVVRGNPV
ncbi:hypothetical protein Shyhy02_64030 [Streptomyces hygroscopicus subsp. hygroscopicus]|nr:hypothetical protein Shyhy02_64030 [Streptomyces hygroscopicus subsp. hygroscopicus]